MTRAQLTYAILATICWGCYIVVAKIASSERYCNVPPRWTTALMGLGIIAVFACYWLFSGGAQYRANLPSLTAGIGAGLLWAIGMIFAFLALRGGADVARLVPLYNANTLIALVLAIIVLREVPQAREIIKLTTGSALIVFGAILVAR